MTDLQQQTINFWHQKFGAIARLVATASAAHPDAPHVIYPPRITKRNQDSAPATMISVDHRNGLTETFTVAAHPNGLADMTMELSWISADEREFRTYRITTLPLSSPDIIKWLKGRKEQTDFGRHFDLVADRPAPLKAKQLSAKEQRILDILRGLEEQDIKNIHAPMIVRAATSGITNAEVYILLQRLEKKGYVTKEMRQVSVMDLSVDRACYRSVVVGATTTSLGPA